MKKMLDRFKEIIVFLSFSLIGQLAFAGNQNQMSLTEFKANLGKSMHSGIVIVMWAAAAVGAVMIVAGVYSFAQASKHERPAGAKPIVLSICGAVLISAMTIIAVLNSAVTGNTDDTNVLYSSDFSNS